MTESISRTTILLIGALGAVSCTTITRVTDAFVAETYHTEGDKDYQSEQMVSGESCEQYSIIFGRLGARDKPRTTGAALQAALRSVDGTVFLANVAIETEQRSNLLGSSTVCTVVSGAAMVRPTTLSSNASIPQRGDRGEEPDEQAGAILRTGRE